MACLRHMGNMAIMIVVSNVAVAPGIADAL